MSSFGAGFGTTEPEPPGNESPLLKLRSVSKTFRDGSQTTRVFNDLTFDLARGETTSLIGPSGTGKSTLLSLIAGLSSPDSGTITFDGTDITTLNDSDRARLRGRHMGIVMQHGGLIPYLTAAENVALVVQLSNSGRNAKTGRNLLGEFGLAHRSSHLPRQLSGGEVQRVALAMALANNPELLLADEATGELDPATTELIVDMIFRECRERGLTLLFVTHNAELADRSQRTLVLTNGELSSK